MIYLFLDLYNQGTAELKTYFLLIFSLLLIILAIYTPIKYFKNAPSIIVDDQIIQIGKNTYNRNQIKNIILTGKMPFKYIFTYPMEGVAIELKSGEYKFIFNDMYLNIYDIKNQLNKFYNQKNVVEPNNDKNAFVKTLKKYESITFNNNHVLSLNGLMLYGWIFFFSILLTTGDRNPFSSFSGFVVMSVLLLSIPVLLSYQMHYFVLKDNKIHIRNSLWIWRNRKFDLENIHEVVFECPYRLSTSMRIITKDFREKLYPAGNLKNKTWRKLETELKKRGITVRNEAIY